MKQRLKDYNNDWYNPGPWFKRALWYFTSLVFFETRFPIPIFLKIKLLRLFGSSLGKVVIKPCVKIKYPWFLSIGDNSWIGEGTIIDNVGSVSIGCDVCISQRVTIITGNHSWSKETFDLIVQKITISDNVWIGTNSLVLPGANISESSVVCGGSVISGKTVRNGIYSGNPAKIIKYRN